jgi:hypothetical protein
MSSLQHLPTRSLSPDTKINLIIGILTILIGILSSMPAWATWRLTGNRRRRLGHESRSTPIPLAACQGVEELPPINDRVLTCSIQGPPIDAAPLRANPEPELLLGYEFALRFGRSA